MEALRKRFAGRDLPALGVVFALRMTAQQVDNTITEWMADTAGTPARFQILGLLWASEAALIAPALAASPLCLAHERTGSLSPFGQEGPRRAIRLTRIPRDSWMQIQELAQRRALRNLSPCQSHRAYSDL